MVNMLANPCLPRILWLVGQPPSIKRRDRDYFRVTGNPKSNVHEDFGTTMQLDAQSDMESMRDAQGKFLEQLLGDRIHLLTEHVQ